MSAVAASPAPSASSASPVSPRSHLRFPRSVALLTAGYSVRQILGPLAVAPLLHHGYRQALLLAALVVLAADLAAAVLRIGFPHHMVAVRHTVPVLAPERRAVPTDAGP